QERRYIEHVTRSGSRVLGVVEALRLGDVSFEYEPGRPVLTDVSFAVRRGETIGIVGPSGSGKSTLVQLLLGLRLPTAGTYVVNGQPMEEYSSDSWFAQFALVPQDNQLLRASVADNIRFWRTHIEHPEVERAARRAHLHDEITLLPKGYATPLGGGSMDLSGGQRQRLGLARALAGEPSVIVLDEPTSALDLRSESLVRQTLDELSGRTTVFIVAHRMTTLRRCDRIIVIEHGRIDDFDTPSALVQSNPFFREASELSQLI
ncbi:MAG: ATP-binding cassette domain-containing protein, partial [Ilumatobacteraceae bacterium]